MDIHLDRPHSPLPFEEAPQPLECIPWCLEQLCLTIYGIWEAFCAWMQGPAGAPAEEVENDRPCRVIVRVDDRGYKTQQKARGLPPPVWLKILGMLSSPDFIKAIPTCKSTAFTVREWVDVTHRIHFTPQLARKVNLESIHSFDVSQPWEEVVTIALAAKNLTTINCTSMYVVGSEGLKLNQHPKLQRVRNFYGEFYPDQLDLRALQNLQLKYSLSAENANKLAVHPGIEQIVCDRFPDPEYRGKHGEMNLETWNALRKVPQLRALQVSIVSLMSLPEDAFHTWENSQIETLILNVDIRPTQSLPMLADCNKLTTLALILHGNGALLQNIGKCTQLRRLSLGVENLFYGDLLALGSCTRLNYLHVHHHGVHKPSNIESELTVLVNQLPQLRQLRLSGHSFWHYRNTFQQELRERFPRVTVTFGEWRDLFCWNLVR
jgi:hypothetical protein